MYFATYFRVFCTAAIPLSLPLVNRTNAAAERGLNEINIVLVIRLRFECEPNKLREGDLQKFTELGSSFKTLETMTRGYLLTPVAQHRDRLHFKVNVKFTYSN